MKTAKTMTRHPKRMRMSSSGELECWVCWKEGLEEWGWGQVMESPGPHAGRSPLSEEQWKGRSREGGCEERNVTAGQGGNRLRHLSITHAERPGNVKEDGGKCE